MISLRFFSRLTIYIVNTSKYSRKWSIAVLQVPCFRKKKTNDNKIKRMQIYSNILNLCLVAKLQIHARNWLTVEKIIFCPD
jgi:hypothetical protein